MKFNVSIDLDEFWLDNDRDYELSDLLKDSIKSDVIRQIKENIKDQVQKEIKEKTEQFIISRLSVIINDTLAECIDQGEIKKGDGYIKITDHVKNLFLSNNSWNHPDDKIKRIAKEFGEELKIQYNNAFANKIVQNMREQGFLKDDIAQLLLG